MNGGNGPVLALQRLPRGLSTHAQRRLSSPLSVIWPGIVAALAVVEGVLIGTVGIAAVGLLAQGRPSGEIAAVAAAMAAPLIVLLLWAWGQYRVQQLACLRSAFPPVVWAILLGTGLTMLAIEIATGAGPEAERWAAASWVVVGSIVLLHRAAVAVWLRRQLAQGRLVRRVVVIAPQGAMDGAALARDLAAVRGQPCQLNLLSPGPPHAAQARPGNTAEIIAKRVRALKPEEIFIVPDPLFRDGANVALQPPSLLSHALFAELQRLPWPTSVAWPRPGNDGGFVFTTLIEAPLTHTQRFTKRIFDLVGASALLVLCLPAFVLIALLIRLHSPGPVLFRQQRRGLHNEIFEMLKFRSMQVAMCDPLAHRLTSPDDPRLTRIGGVLRRWSLDELPQLLNVLQGTMSLVGPRPHPLRAKAGERLYEEVVADFALRYRVKPGITGWAQVNGLRGNTDSEDKLVRRFGYDMEYIRRWSLWLDFRILLQTPLVSVLGENAY
jgi:exopolysaccharide biosynthesis polyprenyl glycosylphosphotransferase